MIARRLIAAVVSTLALVAVNVGVADSASAAKSTSWDSHSKIQKNRTASTSWD